MALALVINGRPEELASLNPGATLADAVAWLELKADRIAVERNGEITPRGVWVETVLQSGDRLEIVHFVGGGTGGTEPIDVPCGRTVALSG